MTQADIYEFLVENKGKMFSAREINETLKTNNLNNTRTNLRKLLPFVKRELGPGNHNNRDIYYYGIT